MSDFSSVGFVSVQSQSFDIYEHKTGSTNPVTSKRVYLQISGSLSSDLLSLNHIYSR